MNEALQVEYIMIFNPWRFNCVVLANAATSINILKTADASKSSTNCSDDILNQR